MKTVKGDLIKLALANKFDVIIHGCNCFCTMGAGIAKSIKNIFPQAYEADQQTKKGDITKLGNYSFAIVQNINQPLTIINGYTQYDFSGGNLLADYNAIRSLFKRIKINYSGKRIGYPKIGAGLAGGDWDIISQIIDHELEKENHILVEFQK